MPVYLNHERIKKIEAVIIAIHPILFESLSENARVKIGVFGDDPNSYSVTFYDKHKGISVEENLSHQVIHMTESELMVYLKTRASELLA